MRKAGLLFILIISTQLGFAQSASSYLHNSQKIKSTKKIAEIIETTTFFEKKGPTQTTDYTKYDAAGNVLSLNRFDSDEKLIFSNIYKYDDSLRVIRSDKKIWINIIGYQTNYYTNQYDALGNYIQTEYNIKGTPINVTKYYVDNSKHLTKLETYDGKNNLFGYELVSYNVDDNEATIAQYDATNNLINTYTQPISYDNHAEQNHNNKYNENGNLIYWERNTNNNDNICYVEEYKYDKFNNWTSNKRFAYIKNEKGELKNKELNMIKKRILKYLKE